MKPLKLAQKYMDIVFGSGEIEKLHKIFCDDFTFEGPLYKFDSKQEYIHSLQSDPPIDFSYKIIKAFEDEFSACLIYQFSKNNLTLPMVQFFEVQNNKVKKILLVFDSCVFK